VDTTDRECETRLGGSAVMRSVCCLMRRDSTTQANARRVIRDKTYDCALLEPEALPPDLPPVILMVEIGFGKLGLVCEMRCQRT
jgi:hypothetical protein